MHKEKSVSFNQQPKQKHRHQSTTTATTAASSATASDLGYCSPSSSSSSSQPFSTALVLSNSSSMTTGAKARDNNVDTPTGADSTSKRGKRLDEDLEQLDQHLMDITLKDVKFMHGSKFTVFSDVAFQRDFLEAHNELRSHYNAPALTWCQNLAEKACEWAHLVAEKGRVLYNEIPDIGENVILITTNGTNHLPTGKEVTEMWAKQVEKYDFSKPKWSTDCQNFTQLVWKSSRQVGAGRVWLQSKGVVAVVGFYFPRGNRNLLGEFQKNVLPPL